MVGGEDRALRVRDLIEVLIEEHASREGRSREEFPVKEIGARPGEKLHEVLLTEEEGKRTREEKDLFVLLEKAPEGASSEAPAAGAAGTASLFYDSGASRLLDKPAIRRLFQWGLYSLPSGAMDFIKYQCTLDGSRFRQATGFAPRFSLEETFASVRS